MSWVGAAIAAGSAVIGGVASNAAAGKAAKAQKKAAKQASDTEMQMYEQNRTDLAPYREVGYQGLNALASGMGLPGYVASAEGETAPGVGNTSQTPGFGDFNRDFTLADFNADPGYEFRQGEGVKALDRSASARGGIDSGRALKDVVRYGQDYASNEYSNAYTRFNADRDRRFNRLASLSGIGQTATNATAELGTNAANNIASGQLAVGNANAARAINTGNAISDTASSLGQFYLMSKYLPKTTTTPAATGTP